MKASVASILLAGLATGVAAKKPAPGTFKAQELEAFNAPAAIDMSVLKQKKISQHEKDAAAGAYAEDRYERASAVPCVDGKAGEYQCNNVDLLDFIRHQDTNSRTREGNDVWGWTHGASGREFALLGQSDGTAFVEVAKDGSLTYVGRLPTQTVASSWRDIKVIKNHAYIGSEAPDHGVQIFDLTKLLDADKENPPTFSLRDNRAHFSAFGSSHNLVAHEETDLIMAVGTAYTAGCRGGLWMIDVSNPDRPQDAGCVSSDGYVHDAQAFIYHGPDQRFVGRELVWGFNEDALTLYDITRRTMPRQISRTTYYGATYTHQGWMTEDHKYLLLDDELDEQEKTGPAESQHTTTYIVDITDPTFPVFRGVYHSDEKSIDHNQYIIGDISYQANYGSGLRMLNVSSLNEDDTGANIETIGYFDVRPEDDEVGGEATFNGAWSVYPYFPSGNIVVSSIERGLYSLRYSG